VIPLSFVLFLRASISNQLAHSGKSWANIFTMHHSGTYANQWMILDYSKFTSGSAPKPHFLTVLEEVPGYIHFEDMTQKLIVSFLLFFLFQFLWLTSFVLCSSFLCFQGDGYWASYNNPYYYDIARITGQYELCLEDPNNCYANDPRAVIFREHQANVRSVDDLKWLMTLNDYETEPASKGDPCNVTALLL
jgi:hypothetical protein